MQYENMKGKNWLPVNCKECFSAKDPESLFNGYCLACIKQTTKIIESVKHLQDLIKDKLEEFNRVKN